MINTLNKLQLEILLCGKGFDGNLNFGAVVLEHNGKKYPLDITDSTGYKGEDIAGLGALEYLVVCKFESDYNEVKEMFSNFSEDYSFELTTDILKSKETSGVINLHLPDEDKLSNINIGRVSNMVITSTVDTSINISVKQCFKL